MSHGSSTGYTRRRLAMACAALAAAGAYSPLYSQERETRPKPMPGVIIEPYRPGGGAQQEGNAPPAAPDDGGRYPGEAPMPGCPANAKPLELIV
jgi:hypothetical protein